MIEAHWLFGVSGDHFIAKLLDGRSVGDLLRPFLFIDRREILITLEGKVVEVFQHLAGDGSSFHQVRRERHALHGNR